MATKVSAVYTASLNQSITTKNGLIVKVTTWTTGEPLSTSRVEPTSSKVVVQRVRRPRRK